CQQSQSEVAEIGTIGHDTVRVERLDRIVALLDVVDIHRVADPRQVEHPLHIGGEIGVFGEAPQIALEQAMIGRVEADKGDEQTNVGLGKGWSKQERTFGQKRLHLVQHGEHAAIGLVIGDLGSGKTRAVDAVVERRIDAIVERVYAVAKGARVKID